MKKLTILPIALAAFMIEGCALTTAGVKKGDERNFVRSMDDLSAGRAIKARLSRAHDFDLNKVDVEVAEGIVVLTGSVPTQEDRREAEKIAWSGPNIVQVGNEITLNSKTGLVRSSKDTFLGAAVRSRLIAEKNVKARNVNIETHNGVVYLMGVARDQAELERMAYIASTTDGTKEVISYVKIAGQPVTTNASFASTPSQLASPGYIAPESFGAPTQMPPLDPSIPRLPAPGDIPGDLTAQRDLPPLPMAGAPVDENAPFYRDPNTGERIVLPPGTKTVPYDPGTGTLPGAPKVGESPYYINPSNGEKVQIVWTGG